MLRGSGPMLPGTRPEPTIGLPGVGPDPLRRTARRPGWLVAGVVAVVVVGVLVAAVVVLSRRTASSATPAVAAPPAEVSTTAAATSQDGPTPPPGTSTSLPVPSAQAGLITAPASAAGPAAGTVTVTAPPPVTVTAPPTVTVTAPPPVTMVLTAPPVTTEQVDPGVGVDQGPYAAGSDYWVFSSPSGNIRCGLASTGARCVISSFAYATPGEPAGQVCTGSPWGSVFDLGDGLPGTIGCKSSDGLGGRTLPYGAALVAGTFSCSSQASGVACRDSAGHGFRVSSSSFDLS